MYVWLLWFLDKDFMQNSFAPQFKSGILHVVCKDAYMHMMCILYSKQLPFDIGCLKAIARSQSTHSYVSRGWQIRHFGNKKVWSDWESDFLLLCHFQVS